MMTIKILLSAISFFLFSSQTQEEKTTIVFVCEHGGARSTIASVYFNKMAKEHHLAYQSIFRGLTPDSAITRETKKGLTKDGFETKSLSPVPLSEKDIQSNTLLISLDCSPPSSYLMYHSWKGIPMISEDYNAARNEILKLVNQLIAELKAKDIKSKSK
jgi:hypothetical protein